MDYNQKIEALEAKRDALEADLVKLTTDLLGAEEGSEKQKRLSEEKHDINQRITAVDNQITMWGNKSPPMTGALLHNDRVQGIVIPLIVTPVVATDNVEPFPIPDIVVDTGCSFMMLLNPVVFDKMVQHMHLTVCKSRQYVTGGDALEDYVEVRVHLMGQTKLLDVFRRKSDDDVSLFGLVALEMFHLGISPSKQIYRWKSTFCGYAVHRTEGVELLPESPLIPQRE